MNGEQRFNEQLSEWGRAVCRRLRHPFSPDNVGMDLEEFWALRHIDFEVRQGDRIGLIGRNGSGKSTLLKVLSRITAPSEGRVRIAGGSPRCWKSGRIPPGPHRAGKYLPERSDPRHDQERDQKEVR